MLHLLSPVLTMQPRYVLRYMVLILQCVYRAFVIPVTLNIGRICHIGVSRKIYVCLIIAIPITYIYISIKVMDEKFITKNRVQDYMYPFQDFYENDSYYKLKQRHSKRLKLNRQRKFVLLWNSPIDKTFYQFEEGHNIFTKNRCQYNNCFITRNEHYFSDIRYFHAIVFGLETTKIKLNKLPTKRSSYQKYIFFSLEPPQMNPACDFDGFFNWTWTYRLDSDIRWGLVIRDTSDNIVGPKQNMKWISTNVSSFGDDSENKNLEAELSTKYIAAAWLAVDEWSFNVRQKILAQLKTILAEFSLKLDIIGNRGRYCKESNANFTCNDVIEKFYYFYLAYEKAMSVDYVTPILLNALQHNAVPVVYGGADYSRFLPPGSYLDANVFDPDSLAEIMSTIIHSKSRYRTFFGWKKHYSFHNTNNRSDTNEFCRLCALLNEESFVKSSMYENFSTWWNSSECKSDIVSNDSD